MNERNLSTDSRINIHLDIIPESRTSTTERKSERGWKSHRGVRLKWQLVDSSHGSQKRVKQSWQLRNLCTGETIFQEEKPSKNLESSQQRPALNKN